MKIFLFSSLELFNFFTIIMNLFDVSFWKKRNKIEKRKKNSTGTIYQMWFACVTFFGGEKHHLTNCLGWELHTRQHSDKLQWKVWYTHKNHHHDHYECHQVWARCWEPASAAVHLEVRQPRSQRHGHPLGKQVILSNWFSGDHPHLKRFGKYSPQLSLKYIQIGGEIGWSRRIDRVEYSQIGRHPLLNFSPVLTSIIINTNEWQQP